MWAGFLGAMGVKAESMFGDAKAFALGNSMLAFFYRCVVELLNPTTVQAHQMVMVLTFIEFVNGFAALKMIAAQNASLFELG